MKAHNINVVESVMMHREQQIRVRVLQDKVYFVAADIGAVIGHSGAGVVRQFAGVREYARKVPTYNKNGRKSRRRVWLLKLEGVVQVLERSGSPLSVNLARHLLNDVLPRVAKVSADSLGQSFAPNSEAIDISAAKVGVIRPGACGADVCGRDKSRATRALRAADRLVRLSRGGKA
jgi:prophage antirepressor-like protein